MSPAVGSFPINQPKRPTLKRYGLSVEAWQNIGERQGWKCAICEKVPTTGRLVIDHEHVRGWRQMPPGMRSRFVRGLLCWFCNKQTVGKGATIKRLRNAAGYLEAHEARKAWG